MTHNLLNLVFGWVLNLVFGWVLNCLLPAFSKLIEKIMFDKVMLFLDSHNVLFKHQL